MFFRLMHIWEDDNGQLFVACQRECSHGEIMNRIFGPFQASDELDVYDWLRLWLATQAEEADMQQRGAREIPADIAELVGKPVDTDELRQRYSTILDNLRARLAQEHEHPGHVHEH